MFATVTVAQWNETDREFYL